MAKNLTIESFNDILFSAMKDEGKKTELLAHELAMAYSMKVEAMEELVACLNERRPYGDALDRVNNIDASCDKLGAMMDAAEKEESTDG